jgi:hypothetical protein
MHAPGALFGGPPPSTLTNAMIVPVRGVKKRHKNSALIHEKHCRMRTGKICPVLTNRQAAQLRLQPFPIGHASL